MASRPKKDFSLSLRQLAKMANLTISSQEEQSLKSQLTETLKSFSILRRLKGLVALSPTFQVSKAVNIVREDQKKNSLPRKSILKKGSYFIAKK